MYVLSVAAFKIQGQSWIVVAGFVAYGTENIYYPALQEKVFQPQL